MYSPNCHDDSLEEYRALNGDVMLWCVSVERIVEITGPDASDFTNRLPPRPHQVRRRAKQVRADHSRLSGWRIRR